MDQYLTVILVSFQYPTLARMACDYLAIQRSSVSSEKAFSAGGRTGTVDRNQLGTKTFEALQTLRSAYKNKVVSALEEATAVAPKDWAMDI